MNEDIVDCVSSSGWSVNGLMNELMNERKKKMNGWMIGFVFFALSV